MWEAKTGGDLTLERRELIWMRSMCMGRSSEGGPSWSAQGGAARTYRSEKSEDGVWLPEWLENERWNLGLPRVFYFFLFFKIYFWLCWVFIAARGLSLVAVSRDYSSLRCAGFSLQWLLLLRSTGSRRVGFSSCGSRALECRLSSCGSRA